MCFSSFPLYIKVKEETTMVKEVVIGIVITVVGLFMLTAVSKFGNSSGGNGTDNSPTTETVDGNSVKVAISGEINHPGSYYVSPDGTLGDLITMAGGVTSKADETTYNTSLVISTRTSFYIAPLSVNSGLCVDTTLDKVNINVALSDALLEVGFNSTQAPNIVDYRLSNGAFQALEDVMSVKGVGQATFEKVKNKICIA